MNGPLDARRGRSSLAIGVVLAATLALAGTALADGTDQKLVASDAAAAEFFGKAVAVSGDTTVVGATGDGTGNGAAYVYVRCNGFLVEQAKLTASDGAVQDFFGAAVAIDGDTIVVGARFAEDDGEPVGAGLAYVFTRTAGVWTQQQKLTASDAAVNDQFGASVAVNGDSIAVGAPRAQPAGAQALDGAIYAFTRSGTTWSEQQILGGTDGAGEDHIHLGQSVAIDGDTILAGAEDDFTGPDAGAAFVFTRDGTTWSQQARFANPGGTQANDFGFAVALEGDTAMVTANRDDEDGAESGAAYVYTRTATTWSAPVTVTPSDAGAGKRFGLAASLSGDYLAIGATASAYVFRRAEGVWSQWHQYTEADDASPGVALGSATALSGGTLVLGAQSDAHAGANSGAAYTFRVAQKLVASDATADDRFGDAVDADGDTLVVGAPNDDDAGAGDGGSVHVFRRTPAGWSLEAKLEAFDDTVDQFGIAVAVHGDTVVVGAPGDDSEGVDAGAAYVFTRSGTTWTEEARLIASDANAGDLFGGSVAAHGDTIAVGARRADAPGAAGGEAGAAYVFTRSGTTWTEEEKITAADAEGGDHFGLAVALALDVLVVGAPNDGDGGDDSGSAYVFTRSGTTWTEREKITETNPSTFAYFGSSVSATAGIVAVGAYHSNELAQRAGAAYLYGRIAIANQWVLLEVLTASDGDGFDQFGFSVDVVGDTVVVGANGDEAEGTASGSAYVFRRTSTHRWDELTKLTAPDADARDRFGSTVAVSGQYVVIGAPLDDDAGESSGSAHVFTFSALHPGSQYTRVAKLTPAARTPFQYFGPALDASGDTVVVGEPWYSGVGASSGAAYAFTRSRDGWGQRQLLTASDAAADDQFGSSVAVDGNTMVVGSPFDDDAGSGGGGSAHVFTRTGATWAFQAKLEAFDAQVDGFGSSVAVSGDTVVVGAIGSDDGISRINAGAAYVFTRSGTTWTEQQKLTAMDAAGGDEFGVSVAVTGDTVVVGAYRHDGDVPDNGAAYVFVRAGATWTQQSKLAAFHFAGGHRFGIDVAVSGETIVVGESPEPDDDEVPSLRAHVFTRSGTAWSLQQQLTSGNVFAEDSFGYSVDVSGDTIVVGAPYDYGFGTARGAAYVFLRSGGSWARHQKLTVSDAEEVSFFGDAVAATDEAVVIGAPLDIRDSDASGVSVYEVPGVEFDGIAFPAAATTTTAFSTVPSVPRGAATGPFQWTVVSGTFPFAGALDIATGAIDSTWAAVGDYDFTVRVTDACGAFVDCPYTVTVNPLPTIDPFTFPDSTTTATFNGQLAVTGGTGPFTWSVPVGTFPLPGALDPDTAAVSGTWTTPGDYDFTVRVTDACGAVADQVHSVTVNAKPTFDAYTFPDSTTTTAFVHQLTVSDGTGPFTWEVSAGTFPLPGGLDEASGLVDGVWDVPSDYDFTLRVTDKDGFSSVSVQSVTVNPYPEITTDALPLAVQGRPYRFPLALTGGTPVFGWMLDAGATPTGLGVDIGTGVLGGTTPTPGRFAFDAEVTDSSGATTDAALELLVIPRVVFPEKKTKLKEVLPGAANKSVDPLTTRALELVGGSTLTVKVKFPKADPPPVTLQVLDAAGEPLVLGDHFKSKKKSLLLKKLPIEHTGRYFVALERAEGFDGDIKLLIKVTPPKKDTDETTVSDTEQPIVVVSSLPLAKLKITVKAAKGIDVAPTILSIQDADDTELLVPEDLRLGPKSGSTKVIASAIGGDLRIQFGARDGSAGNVTWKVTGKSPKGYGFALPGLDAGAPAPDDD